MSDGKSAPKWRQVRPVPGRGGRAAASLIVAVLLLAAFIWFAFRLLGSLFGSAAPDFEPAPLRSELPPEPSTPPISFAGFDPGNIITDEQFYNSEAMSLEDVQEFIAEVNTGCRTGHDGTPCLSAYTEDSPTFPANASCFEFTGKADDTAAEIIHRAGVSCGINPQALLVMLQKEQGLLTASSWRLTPNRYLIAMGYGCPDHTDCDPQFFGFANQVYHAAKQLRMYANAPEEYSIAAGSENTLQLHPNPDCGTQTLYIENAATAGLYNYTPYVADEAALAGDPGGCSSVGNLNFYGFFQAWFGPAETLGTESPPGDETGGGQDG